MGTCNGLDSQIDDNDDFWILGDSFAILMAHHRSTENYGFIQSPEGTTLWDQWFFWS